MTEGTARVLDYAARLVGTPGRLCRGHMAEKRNGEPCAFECDGAVKWDCMGAINVAARHFYGDAWLRPAIAARATLARYAVPSDARDPVFVLTDLVDNREIDDATILELMRRAAIAASWVRAEEANAA